MQKPSNKIRIGYAPQSSYLLEMQLLHDYFEFVPVEQCTEQDIVLSEILDPVEHPGNIVVNNLFEQTQEYTGPCFQLKGTVFFWAHEYYLNRKFGYHTVSTSSGHKPLRALMPMGFKRSFRDRVFKQFDPLLDSMYWSYAERRLPGDINFDRGLNPTWYKDTYASVVVETAVNGPLFVTEKTFKPIAFEHPFLIIAQPYVLELLKSNGFVTFDNIFDESYDALKNFDDRLGRVYNNVEAIEDTFHDAETLERIAHNKNHFYNQQHVNAVVQREVIEPLLEYAETR
jgi:hypothetical protein